MDRTIMKTALAAAGLLAQLAVAEPAKEEGGAQADYTAMSPDELAEYLIFEAKGFDLDQQTQEGGTVRDRLRQDELQTACSKLRGESVGSDTAARVIAMARESIRYPEGGIRLGDWKKGEEIARSGYGFRVGHRTDDHSDTEPGGNCYACHQLDPAEIAHGTIGPSLTGYGAQRGRDEAVLKYTYEVIYNPHASFPCTHMPRFGANGVLNEQQIRDVMAYLLDPESPVNR